MIKIFGFVSIVSTLGLCTLLAVVVHCGGSSKSDAPAISSSKTISSFNIVSPSATGIIDVQLNTIAVTVPYGTNKNSLTPAITITGASVNPPSGAAQNFTTPVTYTVTAADGTTAAYTVTVTVATNNAKAITGFTILGVSGTIASNAITLTVPYGTDKHSLTPTITITGASISPPSGAAQDFTSPVPYTVTAVDGTTANYTVTVNVALNPAKAITGFTILGQGGTITSNTVTVNVPVGTNLLSLTPTITISAGATILPASGSAQNFTNPVLYTVTAADGTIATYTVPAWCSDYALDGTETDIDCGGPLCAKCSIGKSCMVNSDCASNNCSGSPKTCH